jgi:hypothetical protein
MSDIYLRLRKYTFLECVELTAMVSEVGLMETYETAFPLKTLMVLMRRGLRMLAML